MQGQPSRRQLHSQHRALSRALMDSELQNLRRKGVATVTRLQERSKRINNRSTLIETKKQNNININNNNNSFNNNLPQLDNSKNNNNNQSLIEIDNNISNSNNSNNGNCNDFITIRLNEVIVLFNEVDRAAKKLEQLTEQRRERLREMTRQRALEEEINEVSFICPLYYYFQSDCCAIYEARSARLSGMTGQRTIWWHRAADLKNKSLVIIGAACFLDRSYYSAAYESLRQCQLIRTPA